MKVLAPLAISLILVSGCSSTPENKPEYDELEVIRYEICLETHANYLRQKYFGTNTTSDLVQVATLVCKDLQPKKK